MSVRVKYAGNTKKPKGFLIYVRIAMATFILSFIGLILAGALTKDPPQKDLFQQLENAKINKEQGKAAWILALLARKYPRNIDLQYEYIKTAYFVHAEYEGMLDFFTQQAADSSFIISDIGFFGLGQIALMEKKSSEALDLFSKVKNRNLKYLNNSIGLCHYRLDVNGK